MTKRKALDWLAFTSVLRTPPPSPDAVAHTVRAWGYIRVSSEEQRESGLSLEYQERRCRDFWERELKPLGIEWAELLNDEGISAFKKPLFQRPMGQKLLVEARPGDRIIITRFDRVFRSMPDFVRCLEVFESRGISMDLLDCPMDYSTANGRAMLQMMCVFAEWESRIKSERTKAALAIRRSQGKPVNGKRVGYRTVLHGTDRIQVPDYEIRKVLREIVRLRDDEGIESWDAIARLIEEEDCRRTHRPFRPGAFHRWRWTRRRVQGGYRAWKQILEVEGDAALPDHVFKERRNVAI